MPYFHQDEPLTHGYWKKSLFILSLTMSLISKSDSVLPGLHHHTIPKQSYNTALGAIEANCLQRAAQFNESAVQRMQRQQAMIGSQLQRIDECLKRTPDGHMPAVDAGRAGSGLVDNDLLQGIGSQFDGVSGPNPKSHGH